MNNPNLLPEDYEPSHREKHFAIEIGEASGPRVRGEIKLSVTHNGYQWSSLALSPEEALLLCANITAYLAANPAKDKP